MKSMFAGIVGGAAGGALAVAASPLFFRAAPPDRPGTDIATTEPASGALADDRPRMVEASGSPTPMPPNEQREIATALPPSPTAGPAPQLPTPAPEPMAPPAPISDGPVAITPADDQEPVASTTAAPAAASEQAAASAPFAPSESIPPKLAAAAEALRSFRLVVPGLPSGQRPSADPPHGRPAAMQAAAPPEAHAAPAAAVDGSAVVPAAPPRSPAIIARTSTIPRRPGASRAAPTTMLPEADASALMRASDAIDRLSRRVRGRNAG